MFFIFGIKAMLYSLPPPYMGMGGGEEKMYHTLIDIGWPSGLMVIALDSQLTHGYSNGSEWWELKNLTRS